MPRSSESVAALASALAKAQAELVNPEKSLTATINGSRPGEAERSFRYAPLSSGLDIVRKTLGQHNIPTDDRDRPDRRHCQSDYHVGARLGMLGVMPSSLWSGLPARTISTRRI